MALASLFDDFLVQGESERGMVMMDAINRKMGSDRLTTGASELRSNWAMRRDRKSPAYATECNELLVVGE